MRALCLANNVSTIVDRIERDQRVRHCAINVQGVVAKVTSGPVTKPTCRDDDAGMRAASGMGLTCADVHTRDMCVMFNTKMMPKTTVSVRVHTPSRVLVAVAQPRASCG